MPATAYVYGQPEGLVFSRGQTMTISDNNAHLLGCVPPGHKARLTLEKVTTDVTVGVSCQPKADYSANVVPGIVRSTAAVTDLELNDPNGAGFPVFVFKNVSGSADFKATLSVEDSGWYEPIGAYPQVIDTHGARVAPGAEAQYCEVTKPDGVANNDLLVLWFAIDGNVPSPTVHRWSVAGGAWVDETANWSYVGTMGARVPEVRCFVRMATATDAAADITKYKVDAGAGTYEWGIQLQCLRREGASGLSSYGLGMLGTGFPPLWNGSATGAKTGTSVTAGAFQNVNGQACLLNADSELAAKKMLQSIPRLALVCFAAGENAGAPDYPTVPWQQVQSKDTRTNPTPKTITAGEMKAANEMIGACGLVLVEGDVQITAWALFNSTPFNYQGACLILGLFS